MKKTLLELMIEADVKWPEGAEFAAQDRDDNACHFYNEKPKLLTGFGIWDGDYHSYWVALTSLCHNWHQAIVTREQYEAAQVGQTNKLPTTCGETNKTIEQKIKDMVFHQESIARYQEQVEANQAVVDNLRAEIAADLAALEWG